MSIKEFIKSLEKNKNSSELQTLYKKPKPETKPVEVKSRPFARVHESIKVLDKVNLIYLLQSIATVQSLPASI